MKHLLSLFLLFALLPVSAATHVLRTATGCLVLTADDGAGTARMQYYGAQLSQTEAEGLVAARLGLNADVYPCFGLNSQGEKALTLRMPDGTMSVDLALRQVARTTAAEGECLTFTYRDRVYPLTVTQHYLAYAGTDVVAVWTDFNNAGTRPIALLDYASACLTLPRGDNWLTQFHGTWAAEGTMTQQPLPTGISVISAGDDIRNAFDSQPGFVITADGEPRENAGTAFGATLAWTGAYRTRICATPQAVQVIAGIDPSHATFYLKKGETFSTPRLLTAVSREGKGGVSRAFHRWALRYGLHGASKDRDVLLNSWEGVYFDVNYPNMDRMMGDLAALGGELFVMDDGWFGTRYPRLTDNAALGDWDVDTRKLPDGLPSLTAAARCHGVKFGIWIEPEMVNTTSLLYEAHPDWVLQQRNRPVQRGRGGTQMVLDMCNPRVQDFVVGVVDRLVKQCPDLAYIKWDANMSIASYASPYLAADRQSELAVRYNQGLAAACQRIRAAHPDIVMQDCSSGGGRVNYGMLQWFDEFWTSDDTDAHQRVFIQWAASHFFPAKAMAAHVSASPNHQTGRVVPLKFRFDVAMSGRLGLELQPAKMDSTDLAFARRCVAAYKSVRPVVQNGDLYRLASPYATPCAALMYATPDKSRAVLYAYRLQYLMNQHMPTITLDGLDPARQYRVRDLTPRDPTKPSPLDGQLLSGAALTSQGLPLATLLPHIDSSLAFELIAQ